VASSAEIIRLTVPRGNDYYAIPTGMVNDHVVGCYREAEVAEGA